MGRDHESQDTQAWRTVKRAATKLLRTRDAGQGQTRIEQVRGADGWAPGGLATYRSVHPAVARISESSASSPGPPAARAPGVRLVIELIESESNY